MSDSGSATGPTAAVLTVSDRVSAGAATDGSGPALVEVLRSRLGATIVATACVPDDRAAIAERIRGWTSEFSEVDLILTTGGTGFGPRDLTPEAVRPLLEREAPGLMELARHRTSASSPRAYLSRGVAGTIGRTIVVTLPGSPRGATEQLEAICDLLPHALATLRAVEDGHTSGG
jgi:molybdenum cofactor synthesis domain-containing protein